MRLPHYGEFFRSERNRELHNADGEFPRQRADLEGSPSEFLVIESACFLPHVIPRVQTSKYITLRVRGRSKVLRSKFMSETQYDQMKHLSAVDGKCLKHETIR